MSYRREYHINCAARLLVDWSMTAPAHGHPCAQECFDHTRYYLGILKGRWSLVTVYWTCQIVSCALFHQPCRVYRSALHFHAPSGGPKLNFLILAKSCNRVCRSGRWSPHACLVWSRRRAPYPAAQEPTRKEAHSEHNEVNRLVSSAYSQATRIWAFPSINVFASTYKCVMRERQGIRAARISAEL